MRLFVIVSDVPARCDDRPGVNAVHIVANALVEALVSLGHRIALQILFNVHRRAAGLAEAEQDDLHHLERAGVAVQEPAFVLPYVPRSPARWTPSYIADRIQVAGGRLPIANYYPAVRAARLVSDRIDGTGADAVLTLWSPEGVAATFGERRCPRVAYHGDVDYTHAALSLTPEGVLLRPSGAVTESGAAARVRRWLSRRRLAGLKQAHFTLMRDVDCIANVTACNARFYASAGHPRSIYSRNTWVDLGSTGSRTERFGQRRVVKIIGHVGRLSATGSTFGLHFLATEVMPALRRLMADVPHEVHVIGGGAPAQSVQEVLADSGVILRGFVQNLDAELRSCDVFLMLNNVGPYRAAFTRHIVAWSMGLCLVTHVNSQEAIPEIRHMENALVGATGEQIAMGIRQAATDSELNWRLRTAGRTTFEAAFTPLGVAGGLQDEVRRLVAERS
ncbi:MAG: glycosyltransferase family 4 protein [Chloroflexota bacterium]